MTSHWLLAACLLLVVSVSTGRGLTCYSCQWLHRSIPSNYIHVEEDPACRDRGIGRKHLPDSQPESGPNSCYTMSAYFNGKPFIVDRTVGNRQSLLSKFDKLSLPEHFQWPEGRCADVEVEARTLRICACNGDYCNDQPVLHLDLMPRGLALETSSSSTDAILTTSDATANVSDVGSSDVLVETSSSPSDAVSTALDATASVSAPASRHLAGQMRHSSENATADESASVSSSLSHNRAMWSAVTLPLLLLSLFHWLDVL